MEIWNQFERRRHLRIKKNYFISYCAKSDPMHRYDATQIKDLSVGGMCFITSHQYVAGTAIVIELKTPYSTETIPLEGKVIACHEKFANKFYQTHIEFEDINSQAEWALKKIIEQSTLK